MPTLDNLAARFAQCVSLFRDPSAKAQQKKEFRALLGLLQDAAVTLRLAPGGSVCYGWWSASTPTEWARSPSPRPRPPPSCSSCCRRLPTSPARTTSRADSPQRAPTASVSRPPVRPHLLRRRNAARLPRPRILVDASLSSPTRTRR